MSPLYLESEMRMPAGMVRLPLRCMVVKTSNGVVVISPIDFASEQIRKIEQLGQVTDIVAPSLLHHLHVKSAAQQFRSAKLWGPPGCEQKRPDVKWDCVLTRDPWPHESDLPMLLLEGMPENNEVLFFDRPSRTLMATDLFFNIQNPKGWAAPIVFRIFGTYKRFGTSRLFEKYVKDKNAYQASLKRMMSWDFDRIAMAHGDLIDSGAKALVKL